MQILNDRTIDLLNKHLEQLNKEASAHFEAWQQTDDTRFRTIYHEKWTLFTSITLMLEYYTKEAKIKVPPIYFEECIGDEWFERVEFVSLEEFEDLSRCEYGPNWKDFIRNIRFDK
jgi:hypothetical protein